MSTRRGPLSARGRALVALFVSLVALGAGALAAGPADASGVAIRSFSTTPTTTQAGAHPDVTLQYTTDSPLGPNTGDPCFCNAQKDSFISFPAGFIGNPHAGPQCNSQEFALNLCPVDSQVGVAEPGVDFFAECPPKEGTFGCFKFTTPIYNLVPAPGQAGLLGFKTIIFRTNIYTALSSRTGTDYGLNATTLGIGRLFAVAELRLRTVGGAGEPEPRRQALSPGRAAVLLLRAGSGIIKQPGRTVPAEPDDLQRAVGTAGYTSSPTTRGKPNARRRGRARPGAISSASTRAWWQSRRRPKRTRPPALTWI